MAKQRSDDSTIGGRLQIAREARGISQSGLARAMDITRSAIWHWDQNKVDPTIEHLRKAADFLRVSYEWLATGRGKGPDGATHDSAAYQQESGRRALASESGEEAWVFPSSFIREAARAPATRLVTVEAATEAGNVVVEVTIVGRARPLRG